MFNNSESSPSQSAEGSSSSEGSNKPQSFTEIEAMSGDDLEKIIPAIKETNKEPLQPEVKELEEDEDFEEEEVDSEEEVDEETSEDGDEDEEEDSEDAENEDAEEDTEEIFLEQTVNGKLKKFTEKQVRNIIASGAHTLEKATEFENHRIQVTKELDDVVKSIEVERQKISPVLEQLQKKNIEGAIGLLANEVGLDKLQVKRALIQQVAPVIFKRLGLPPEWVQKRLQEMAPQNRLDDAEEESSWAIEKAKKLEEASKPKPPTEDEIALGGFTDVRMQLGIGQKEFDRVLSFIERTEGSDVKVTASYFGEVCQMMRAVDRSVQAIKAVRPQLVNDRKFVDFIRVKAQKHLDWGVDKLARFVEKEARQRAETQKKREMDSLTKDISRKALKNQPKSSFENPGAKQKPMKFEDVDPDNFELP